MSEPVKPIKCSRDGDYGLPEFTTEYCNKKYMISQNILPENILRKRAELDKKFREEFDNSLKGILQRSITSFNSAAHSLKNIGKNNEDPVTKADKLQYLVTFLQGIMRTTLMRDNVDIKNQDALRDWLAKYDFDKEIQLLKNILIADMGRQLHEDDTISVDNLNHIALEIMFTGSTDFSGEEKTIDDMIEMSQQIPQTDDEEWNNFIQQHHPEMNGGKRKKQRTYKRQNTQKKRKTRKRQKKQRTRKRQNAQKKRRTHKRR